MKSSLARAVLCLTTIGVVGALSGCTTGPTTTPPKTPTVPATSPVAPTRAPSATSAPTDDWAAMPEPTFVTPTSVPAAISLDDAIRFTLDQIDPLDEPRLVAAGSMKYDDRGQPFFIGGHAPSIDEAEDDRWLYVVILRVRPVNPAPEFFATYPPGPTPVVDPPGISRLVGAAYDMVTGEELDFRSIGDDYDWIDGAVALTVPRVDVGTATLAPSATPTYFPTARPTTTPSDEERRLPSGPPVDFGSLSDEMQNALRAYPLVPGSRWTYMMRSWLNGRSGHHLVTETVTSATVIGRDRLLVAVRREAGHDFGAPMPSTDEEPEAAYWVIDGGRLSRVEDAPQVHQWLDWIDLPTVTPSPGQPFVFGNVPHDRQDRSLPSLMWPADVGDSWPREVPLEGMEVGWAVVLRTSVTVPAGKFQSCLELASEDVPGGSYRWLCPGVGFVRDEYYSWNRSPHWWTVYDLVSYEVP